MTYAICTNNSSINVITTRVFHTGGTGLLTFRPDIGGDVTLHLPSHVADATAAAFNRAMQAEPDGGGWTYDTPSGHWSISRDSAMGTVYLCQHEEVTGDGDPAWLFAQADSVMTAMDAIDEVIAENACEDCDALAGSENLVDPGDGVYRCADCYDAWAEHESALDEAAGDDKAHAAREASQ